MTSSSHDPLIGRLLRGTIEIRRRIGEGGMGYVYEGYQKQLDRRVAIKVMTKEHAQSPEATKYFLREAKSSSHLRHPNIIQIIDYGTEPDGLTYLAMEFVPGRPLSDLIKADFPLNTSRITSIIGQALSGLEEAHAHAIIHRDLKPDNLMIEPTRAGKDFVKILDFGIAHRQNQESTPESLTAAGALLGTPQYMSPEQACGQRVDARSDLFSMGIILYELLTAQLPFRGENLPKLLMAIVSEEPQAPSARRPDLTINPDLESICLRALAKDKALRYQSAEEFRLAIQEVQSTGSFAPVKRQKPAQFIFKRRGRRSAQDDLHDASHSADAFGETIAPTPSPALDARPSLAPREAQTEHGKVPSSFEPSTLQDELSDAHVIDINSLLSSNEAMAAPRLTEELPLELEPAHAQTHAPQPQTPAPRPSSTLSLQSSQPSQPSQTALRAGLAASLRDELIGTSFHVVALVIHQRTERALDPEELMELYELLDQLCADAAQRWEGTLQSRQGGFITLLFGLPTARRDDAFRAVQTALDLRRRLIKQPIEGVKFGLAIAHGEVYRPPDGDLSRIAGMPIEQASEGARMSTPGEVVILNQGLQDQLSASFKLSAQAARGERTVLGLLELDEQPSSHGEQFLVGRDREIASLLAALGRLARQQGALTILTGEGGVGKSALLKETLRLAQQRQFIILSARQRFGAEEGLQDIFRQWCRDYLRQVGQPADRLHVALHELGLGLEYTRILQGFISDRLKETFYGRHQARAVDRDMSAGQLIEAAMRQLFKRLSAQLPLLLTLDEIDPYDEPLARFVSRSSELTRESAVMLLLAARSSHQAQAWPAGAHITQLERLDEASSFAFLRATIPELADTLKSKLVRISGGNPLQLNELARAVKANPDSSPQALERALSQTRDIKELMRLDLQRQPRHIQNILGLLAVLGDGVDAQVVADLAHPDWQVEESLQSLYDEELIVVEQPDEPQLYFHSPVFGHVIYQSLPSRAKQRTHERAAQLYRERLAQPQLYGATQRADYAALIRHLERSGQYDEALSLIERLIQTLMQGYEYERAEEFLARTLELRARAQKAPDASSIQLELQLIRVRAAKGNTAQALSEIVRLSRSPDLPRELSYELRVELASLWLEEEDPQMIEGQLKRTIQEARQDHHQRQDPFALFVAIRAMTTLAQVYEKQDKLPLAINLLVESIELSERFGVKPLDNAWGPALVWEPLNHLGRLRFKGNDLEGAKRLYELAREIIQSANDARGEVSVLANLSALLAAEQDLGQANKLLMRAIKVARTTGQLKPLAKLLHNYGLLCLKQHHPEQAMIALTESEQISQELDWREGLALNAVQLRRLRAQMPS